MTGILAARWFQGMCSSVGNSMVGGTIAGASASVYTQLSVCSIADVAVSSPDLFHAKERGRAMSLYALFVFLGQASSHHALDAQGSALTLRVGLQGIGPLYAGWTADALGWRWVMWIMVIMFGTIFIAACLVLRETRGSYILSQRALRLTKESGRLHSAPVRRLLRKLRCPISSQLILLPNLPGGHGACRSEDHGHAVNLAPTRLSDHRAYCWRHFSLGR